MSFDGDLYPTAGATSVMTTKGDMVDYDTARQRLGIGSANQILQVKSSLPSWETVPLADTVLTTAGDVLYENATPELARLPKGNLNDVLTMGASLPAWSAPAGGGAWENLGSVSSSGTASLSLSVADHDLYMMYYNVSCDASAGSGTFESMRINGDSTANYRSTWSHSSGGAWTTTYNTGADMWRLNGADLYNYSTNNMYGYIYINKPTSNSLVNNLLQMRTISANMSPSGTNYFSTMFGSNTNNTTLTSIQLVISTGVNIQGSFTVNAMDF